MQGAGARENFSLTRETRGTIFLIVSKVNSFPAMRHRRSFNVEIPLRTFARPLRLSAVPFHSTLNIPKHAGNRKDLAKARKGKCR
jgi:hypothetical protein